MLALVAFSACSDPAGPESDALRPIQTDQVQYELVTTGQGWSAVIPFTFTNRTAEAVSLVNCNGSFTIVLERKEGSTWVPRWGTISHLCLSPPLTVSPNHILVDTLDLFAGPFGSNHYPQFETVDPQGTYRLVLPGMVWSYDPDVQGFGTQLPIAERVSNDFLLIGGSS